MRKVFEMQDLDCANCAAKMEEAIRKLEGVTYVSISFMAQRMTIEAPDETFDAVMKEVSRVVRRVEPDCRVLWR